MGTVVFPEECMGKMLTLCEVNLFVFPDLYNKEVTLGKTRVGPNLPEPKTRVPISSSSALLLSIVLRYRRLIRGTILG